MNKPSPYERLVCANIAHARAEAGLTQQGLATAIGVKRPLVGAWEEYRTCPRLPQLVALAASSAAPLMSSSPPAANPIPSMHNHPTAFAVASRRADWIVYLGLPLLLLIACLAGCATARESHQTAAETAAPTAHR